MRQLLDRCVVGEGQAWRDLHRTYYPVACRFLRRMGIEGGELEDACQEVFVQVFRYLAQFERRADFRTWLYKLCLSQASRVRRRHRLHQALGWLLGREPRTGGPSAEPGWTESMAAERVRAALDRMKPIHREVFVLFELEGVEGCEIARVLGCPEGTARRRLHDARIEFEELLRAGAGDDDGRRPR
jgi:RNA polymerase sigma-70 factor, ECF subfamily